METSTHCKSAAVDSSGLNLTTQFAFDAIGNVVGITDHIGDHQLVHADAGRRLVFDIKPDPDGAGPLHRTASRSIYDQNGDLLELDRGSTTSSTGADFLNASPSEVTTWTYDAVGHLVREVNQAGVIQYSWDADDRALCTATRMNPTVYSSLPSSACTLSTSATFGSDRIEESVYDAAGQLTQTIKAEGVQNGPSSPGQYIYAAYTYTGNGKRQTVTDANGNKTTIVYDGFDRVGQEQFPVTGVGQGQSDTADYEAYTYDSNGNRLSVQQRDGSVISYCYDALNRQIAKFLHSIASCAPLPSLTGVDVGTTFDLLDRRLTNLYASGSGVITSWDHAGRELSESTNGRTISYSYDTAGDRLTIQWPDAFSVGYAYDAENRLIGVCERLSGSACQSATTLAQGLLATLSYDSLGRRIAIARSNGTSATSSYDADDRLIALNLVYGQTTYNQTWSFGYDPASELVSENASNDLYNWTAFPSVLASRAYDGLNRDAAITAIGYQPCSTSSGYDCRGNLANEGTGGRSFTYDVENRLVSVNRSGSTVVSLSYDAEGRLDQTVAGGVTTSYLYDRDRQLPSTAVQEICCAVISTALTPRRGRSSGMTFSGSAACAAVVASGPPEMGCCLE